MRKSPGYALGLFFFSGTIAAAGAVGEPVAPGRRERRGPVKLREVLWQALPDRIRAVYRAPGGKLWYQLWREGKRPTAEQTKAIVEREYKREQPQILEYRPVLFEPGGRVWLVEDSQRLLLGYDGEKWIERKPEKLAHFAGTYHLRRVRHETACYLQKRAFVVDSQGVHAYDGKKWSYQKMLEKPEDLYYPRLRPEPDGKGLIAVAQRRKPGVWRWRGGEWKKIALPGVKTDQKWSYVDAAPQGGKGLRVVANVSMATRRTGFLEYGAKQLELSNRVGPFKISDPHLIYCLPDGRVFLSSFSISGGDLASRGAGVLMVDAKGSVSTFCGRELRAGFQASSYRESSPLAVSGADRIWLQGTGDLPPRLLDLKTGKFVAALPSRSFACLQLALRDGTLYASRLSRSYPRRPVMVYRPGKPDDRVFLKTALRIKLARNSARAWSVASDGSIWAESAEHGMVRFAGKGWEEVRELKGRRGLDCLIAGLNGRLLAVFAKKGGAALIRPGGAQWRASLLELVKARRKEVAAAFPGSGFRDGLQLAVPGLCLCADKAGNIWVYSYPKLNVLVGEKWIDASDALIKAAGRQDKVRYLAALGDGSRVYLTDFMPRGASFYGRVEDGKLKFEKAPGVCSGGFHHVRDRGGAVWIAGSKGRAIGTGYTSTAQLAQRLTEKGCVLELKNSGRPFFCDRGGNVWLGDVRGQAHPGRLNVVRAGKVVCTLDLPGVSAFSGFCSPRAGSVLISTERGLLHLTAEKPGKFKVRTTYALPDFRGKSRRLVHSSLGYLLAAGHVAGAEGGTYLHLFKMPGDSPKKRK
jgi:hypothetical protein